MPWFFSRARAAGRATDPWEEDYIIIGFIELTKTEYIKR